MSATHEDYRPKTAHRGPSDRSFGFVGTAAFLFFGLWPLRHGRPLRFWCLALSAALLIVTLVRPSVLHRANRFWIQLGLLLGKVMNPVVMGLLFYLVFTPVAIVLGWMGKDLLRLRREPSATTYWLPRDSARELSNMTDQF